MSEAPKITLVPLYDRIIIDVSKQESVTPSGIIIPDSAREKPQEGIVSAVGPGLKDTPLTVKVGDRVAYGEYAGTEITIQGTKFLMMRESDLYAIIQTEGYV
jgi:chaperonin GroES